MDYTRKGQSVYEPKDFFTSGVGDIPANQNTFESENNLDLTNNQTSWNQGEIRQSVRSIGNMAISTPEAPVDLNTEKQPLGENIEPVSTPPSVPFAPDYSTEKITFDASLIHSDGSGERISNDTLIEIDEAKNKFYQTGDAATWVDTIREMSGQYVSGLRGENTHRKVA